MSAQNRPPQSGEEALAYDPQARRATPLATKLKAQIAGDGPMTIAAFMDACLNDAEFGYYRTQTAIGREGDFITAPEISQIFGEIIGLWAAVTWQQMGAPERFNLIEMGPGRGTLMHDALRAAVVLPEFLDAAQVQLVECNPVLIATQKALLEAPGLNVSWHDDLSTIPEGPSLLIGNEYLDTVRVGQAVKGENGIHQRMVGIDEAGTLQFIAGALAPPHPDPDHNLAAMARWDEQPVGAIDETQVFAELAFDLGDLAEKGPFAALFIDYGHEKSAFGDTLQAVRGHAYEHPLTSPGEADLTVQVDFQSFARQVAGASLITRDGVKRGRTQPLAIDGPIPQAEFLGRLGVLQRASKLMAANADKAPDIEAGVLRLMAPTGMGTRFKALGVRAPELPKLPGFET